MIKDKISSQEIIDLVATKASVSKRAAEEFLKVMISTIEEALLAEEVVKIKGFGTFKLQWNEPRKSVDVTTGGEIILDGYYKVVFTPDNSLKELVNEPFSHLEAVQLDEDNNFIIEEQQEEVALDPLRIFTEQASEIKDLLSEIQALSATEISTKIEDAELDDVIVVNEVEQVDAFAVQFELVEDEIEGDVFIREGSVTGEVITVSDYFSEVHLEPDVQAPELSEIENEINLDELQVVEQESVAQVLTPEPIVEIIDEKLYFISEPVSEQFEEEISDLETNSTPFLVGVKPKKMRKSWMLIPITVVLVGGFVSLYIFYPPANNLGNSIAAKSKAEITYLKENVSIADMFSKVSKWFSPTPTVVVVSKTETVIVPKDSTSTDSVELKEPVDSLQLMFDKQRVYEEFTATEQIKNGSRLTIMSEKYYGNKVFWVYIYEANKERIDNPDNIKSGTLIRIPKLDPRLVDASNPRCVQKALELHDKYVNK